MKRYVFIQERLLPESLLKNSNVTDLVKKMDKSDIIAVLMNDLGLQKDRAELTAGMLIRHAHNSMAMPYGVKRRDLEKQRNEYASFDFLSPVLPVDHEEPDEWPYDDATLGIMQSPWPGGPRMTS